MVGVVDAERELSRNIENEVKRRIGSRVRNLRVSIIDGRVALGGRTLTYHAKQLVQHAVMETCPLRILSNDIEVEPTPGPRPVRVAPKELSA